MLKRFKAFILCVALAAFIMPVFSGIKAFADANASASVSAETVKSGDTFEMIIRVKDTNSGTYGVEFSESEGLTIESGEWLKKGLLSDYDAAKKKGAFASGTAGPVSGDIFKLKLKVKDNTADGVQKVSIRVIAKNGTATVYDETFLQTVTVKADVDAPGTPDGNIGDTDPSQGGKTAAIIAGIAAGVVLAAVAVIIAVNIAGKKAVKTGKNKKSGK